MPIPASKTAVRVLVAAATAGLLLVPLAAAADFGRPAEIPLAKQPETVALGDATQDGKVDVITTSGSTISLLPGRGDGGFDRRIDFAAGSNARSPVFGDWNGDGAEDLALATQGAITTFTGTGGGLVRQRSYPVAAPVFLGAGYLDGDGNLDLVATSSSQATVSVLLGFGDGTFGPASDYRVGSPSTSLAVADLNGDDIADIAAAGSDLSILPGVGDGTFETSQSVPGATGLRSLAADDLEVDGDVDLVGVMGQNQVAVLLNADDGSFPGIASYQVGTTPVGVALGEMDEDGNPDLVTVNRGSNDVSVLLGVGDGTFGPQSRVRVGRAPVALDIGDLTGDATNDLAVANRRSASVTVLLNGANAPQPVVCLVPRVVRRTLKAGRGMVARAHCTLAPVRRKYSKRVKRGRVIAQTPAPGARLPEGSPVALVLSRGPKR
jgi:FG-GAP-like repeat/PASTA domain